MPARFAIVPLVILTCLAILPATFTTGADGSEFLTDKDRQAIETALLERTKHLAEEKNEEGLRFRRGTYSNGFRCESADTCKVTFHEGTASQTQLSTQRLLLTLTRDQAGRKWSITDEKVEDNYSEFYRSQSGDEEFLFFDTFSFHREGVEVSARGGSLIKDYRNGELERMVLTAKELSYDYAPPEQTGYYNTHSVVIKQGKRGLVFDPERIVINCVPASCRQILETSFTGLQEAKLEDLEKSLVRAYNKEIEDRLRTLRKHPFAFFHGVPEEDHRTWTLTIEHKAGSDRRLRMDYDNYEPWQVRVWGPNPYQPLYGYYSEATRKSGIPEDVLERRPDRDGRDYEVSGLQGEIKLALEDPESMVADLTYRLKAKHDLPYLNFSIIRLRLNTDVKETASPQLLINSIQDSTGQEMTWISTGPISGRIILPKPLRKGHNLTLRMRFKNQNCIYDLNHSYKGLARFGWMPFVRFGDMIHYFDLIVEAPAKYKTLGIGTKVSEEVVGNVRRTHWKSNNPVVFPTVIFGDYHEYKPEGVARKLDGTVIPVMMHVDKHAMVTWNIRPRQLKPMAEQAVASINFYRDLFQVDYPYGKMDLVNDPLGFLYGQSPSSIIYLGSGTFRSVGFLVDLGANPTQMVNFSKNLIPHEIAHQWWGSVITNSNMRNYWFVESLAEYSSALFVEAVHGREDYEDRVDLWRRSVLETTPLSSVQNAAALWSDGGYVPSVYNKGPYAFHILRSTFGDEKFFAFFRQLAQELAGKEIVTKDIQHVAEKSFGMNMDWFFDQWIRGIGIPEYVFDYTTRQTEDGKYLIEGKVLQRVVGGTKRRVLEGVYYQGVVPVTITCRGGKEYRKRLLVDGPETAILIKVPEEPRTVELNKGGEILAHQVRKASSF